MSNHIITISLLTSCSFQYSKYVNTNNDLNLNFNPTGMTKNVISRTKLKTKKESYHHKEVYVSKASKKLRDGRKRRQSRLYPIIDLLRNTAIYQSIRRSITAGHQRTSKKSRIESKIYKRYIP